MRRLMAILLWELRPDRLWRYQHAMGAHTR
jgi:hypothetical protein